MTAKRASEKDREYFRKLGRWKAELRATDTAEYLALSPKARQERAERHVRSSLGWARQVPADNALQLFFERAKRLGLYRS